MTIKVEINLTNKWLYSLVALSVLLLLGIGVYAYNSDMNFGNPSLMGHSAGEIDINVDGNAINLQNAINQGLLSGSGGFNDIQIVTKHGGARHNNVEVECPEGYKVISGGWNKTKKRSDSTDRATDNFPSSDTSWTVKYNHGEIDAYAVCVRI